jgi:hypothetical protein
MIKAYQQHASNFGRAAAGLALGLLVALALLPGSAQATPAQLPPRNTPTPVPTATPMPTATPRPAMVSGTSTSTSSGQITLRLRDKSPGGWAVVRWEDGTGTMRDVAGWQGLIPDGGMLTWRVAPQHLGKGPFYWFVFRYRGGPLLYASDAFWLPTTAGRALVIDLPAAGRVTSDPDASRLRWPGSYIELQVEDAPAGLRSVVQWVDGAGEWHDVNGWRGTVTAFGVLGWRVAPGDAGKGPFRWALYGTGSQDPVAISASFYLPDADREVVIVTLRPGDGVSGR